jgi:hypothetical protein
MGLASGSTVFATFRHAGSPPDCDPGAISDAFALPLVPPASGLETILVRFNYETSSVSDYRFPTVADVGWFDLFWPAPYRWPNVGDPKTLVGWTKPLNSQKPQPEIVHSNASLTVLTAPPFFVGVLP